MRADLEADGPIDRDRIKKVYKLLEESIGKMSIDASAQIAAHVQSFTKLSEKAKANNETPPQPSKDMKKMIEIGDRLPSEAEMIELNHAIWTKPQRI